MPTGAITGYIDVAQLVLYAFWIFFFGLVLYLRYEDQREGYPLENEEGPTNRAIYYPPPNKVYSLPGGATTSSNKPDRADIAYAKTSYFIGNPVEPVGDPLKAGVGSGSYAPRADVPDLTFDGHLRIVPTRSDHEFGVASPDNDPRGFEVMGSDKTVAGKIVDLWVDRAEAIFRYYEVETAGRRVLLPVYFTLVSPRKKSAYVDTLTAAQIAEVPGLANPDQVTRLEEDKIVGYFGGGYLYSTPQRKDPWL